MNFYSLSMGYGLPFYIDYEGKFAESSIDNLRIVYNRADQAVLNQIMNHLANDKIKGSHTITEKQKQLLTNQIDVAEKSSKKRIRHDRKKQIESTER